MFKKDKLMFGSIACGAVYGLIMRGLIRIQELHPNSLTSISFIWVMSVAFIMVVPFAMGYIAVGMNARSAPVSWVRRIFLPWPAVLLSLFGCLIVAWEGTICLAMVAPIALLFGTLGGITAGVLLRPQQPRTATFSMVVVVVLPFLVWPLEARLTHTQDIRNVESDVLIHASPETIWANIERVRSIDASELPTSWNRKVGFPRPIEATLSHEGIGGVRHATFAGDVLFIETIDVWEPRRRLGFSIHADTSKIPATTLDEHVTVGGEYFDVLHGEYILEPAGTGTIRLRLISNHRVSTDFNWYARLWTEAVMRDVQQSILYVIQRRCEADATSTVK